jgi:hypothetical protein
MRKGREIKWHADPQESPEAELARLEEQIEDVTDSQLLTVIWARIAELKKELKDGNRD